MKLFKLLSIILIIGFTGCKSTKSLTSVGELDAGLSAKQIIKETEKQVTRFKTLQARVRIDYKDGDKSNGTTVTLRIEKDKVIWMSAPLGIARVMITPERVSFYDKLNNQYFDGDFSLLSDFLGTELDFEKVQNLLLGEPIFNLNDDTYVASIHEKSYVLQPKEQRALFELFFLINPGYFKLDSQQLYQPADKRMLQIDYKTYQEVSKQIFPENIHITALEKADEVTIDLEMKSITLNEEVRFPFEIPEGYKEIVIK